MEMKGSPKVTSRGYNDSIGTYAAGTYTPGQSTAIATLNNSIVRENTPEGYQHENRTFGHQLISQTDISKTDTVIGHLSLPNQQSIDMKSQNILGNGLMNLNIPGV